MRPVLQKIDRLDVVFDEPNLVANAGLVTVSTLMDRLGLEQLVDETVDLGDRPGAANPGRKFLTLLATLIAGGSHIDHAAMLRAGDTRRILGFEVVAGSTLGTFLRLFTWGHVSQLNKVVTESLRRVWAQGVGPGDDRLVIDLDSTICEVSGARKQGAGYGHTSQLSYHPLIASRADTGEIVGVRLRGGGSQKGNKHFVAEVVARTRRAGAAGPILLRADSGFWSRPLIDRCIKLGVDYLITVKLNKTIKTVIAGIADTAWEKTGSNRDRTVEVASTTYLIKGANGKGHRPLQVRLVVRRSPTNTTQTPLFPTYEYRAYVTSLTGPLEEIDHDHRHHAVVELAIRNLKEGAGLSHLPSGHFAANAAWLVATALAHNLTTWTNLLGDPDNQPTITVATSFRTQFINIPGRLVNRAGRPTLRLPTNWPWTQRFGIIFTRLRSLPQLA